MSASVLEPGDIMAVFSRGRVLPMKATVTRKFTYEDKGGKLEHVALDTDKGRFTLSAGAKVRAVLRHGS